MENEDIRDDYATVLQRLADAEANIEALKSAELERATELAERFRTIEADLAELSDSHNSSGDGNSDTVNIAQILIDKYFSADARDYHDNKTRAG